VLFTALIFAIGCKRGGTHIVSEYAYVAAPQVNVRDHLAAIYNKVTVIKNGERVEILEKSRRFVRIRTSGGLEGWVEVRYLVDPAVHDGFEKLAKDYANAPAQAQGSTRFELNMHLTPGRDTEHLYQLGGSEKVQILKRAVAEKNAPNPEAKPIPRRPTVPTSPGNQTRNPKDAAQPQVKPVVAKSKAPDKPPVYEDWYLVRDSQRHVGWVLARMIDVDVPMEIAQYAEGQRIVSCPVLNQVTDAELNKQVPQYLVLATENKDGLPYDFNQLRVFTWNVHRHRYETAYRERNLFGALPVQVGHEVFDKEGDLPTFTVRVQDEATGQFVEKKYKMNGPIVRRVLPPGEQAEKPAVHTSTSPHHAKLKPHVGSRRHRRRG
jgi:SH3-like domain-containing protein